MTGADDARTIGAGADYRQGLEAYLSGRSATVAPPAVLAHLVGVVDSLVKLDQLGPERLIPFVIAAPALRPASLSRSMKRTPVAQRFE